MNEKVKASELIAGMMDEIHEIDPQDSTPLGSDFKTLMTMLERAFEYAKAFCDKE